MTDNRKAYHFINDDFTYRDGTKAKVGVPVVYDGKLDLCKSGLHASKHPYDALKYALGQILCLVECEGPFVYDKDKFACTKRTIIDWADTTEIMRKFARLCALDVVHLWDAPEVVIEYLKTGKEECRETARTAARDAARVAARDIARGITWYIAWYAARAAARAASWDAAWIAARYAARYAARAASWDAARDATRAATRAAARDAARAAARDIARGITWDAARDATRAATRNASWAAAWDTAWDAAERKQRKRFKAMCDRKLRGYK